MAAMVSTISPDNPSQSIKTLLAIIVEYAGGDFVGVQDALPEHGLPAYVLFSHPKQSTARRSHSGSMSTSAQKQFSSASPSATRDSAGIVHPGEFCDINRFYE
jgi:hypothetical protein